METLEWFLLPFVAGFHAYFQSYIREVPQFRLQSPNELKTHPFGLTCFLTLDPSSKPRRFRGFLPALTSEWNLKQLIITILLCRLS